MGAKRKNHDDPMWKRACVGAVIAIAATVVMAGVVGVLEFNEVIGEEKVGVLYHAVQALSVMLGCLLTNGKGRGGAAPITALIYCALLSVMTILFFGGNFARVVPGVLMIIAGMGLALLMKISYKKRGNHIKRKAYSR